MTGQLLTRTQYAGRKMLTLKTETDRERVREKDFKTTTKKDF